MRPTDRPAVRPDSPAVPSFALWRLAWRPLASVAVIGLLVWLVPLGDLLDVLGRTDPLLAALSLSIVLPMAATKAAVFQIAAGVQNMAFGFRRMLAIQLASAFYTLVVPGQIGGTVSRWYKLQKPGRQPVEAAAVMLMARLVETGVACLLGLALAMADPLAWSIGVVPLLALGGLVIVSGWLFLVTEPGRRLGGLVAARLPRHPWLDKLHRALPRLASAALRIRAMRTTTLLRIAACSLLWNALGILSIVLAAAAVAAEVSWITLGWIRCVLAIILLLPLAWGGLGVREASVVALLQPYGIAPAAALAIGALISLRNIIEAVIGGGVELVGLWRRRHRTKPKAIHPANRPHRDTPDNTAGDNELDPVPLR